MGNRKMEEGTYFYSEAYIYVYIYCIIFYNIVYILYTL